jgi:hypothetical protein
MSDPNYQMLETNVTKVEAEVVSQCQNHLDSNIINEYINKSLPGLQNKELQFWVMIASNDKESIERFFSWLNIDQVEDLSRNVSMQLVVDNFFITLNISNNPELFKEKSVHIPTLKMLFKNSSLDEPEFEALEKKFVSSPSIALIQCDLGFPTTDEFKYVQPTFTSHTLKPEDLESNFVDYFKDITDITRLLLINRLVALRKLLLVLGDSCTRKYRIEVNEYLKLLNKERKPSIDTGSEQSKQNTVQTIDPFIKRIEKNTNEILSTEVDQLYNRVKLSKLDSIPESEFDIKEKKKRITIDLRGSFINEVEQQIKSGLTQIKNRLTNKIENDIKGKETEIRQNLTEEERRAIIVVRPSFPKDKVNRIIDSLKLQKSFIKEIAKKGWYQVFTEVRQPMFLVLPIVMMISMLSPIFTAPGGEARYDESKGAILVTDFPTYSGYSSYSESNKQDYYKLFEDKLKKQLKGNLNLKLFDANRSKEGYQVIVTLNTTQTSEGLLVYLSEDGKQRPNEALDWLLTRSDAMKKSDSGRFSIYSIMPYFYPVRIPFVILLGGLLIWMVRKKNKENKDEMVEESNNKYEEIKKSVLTEMTRELNARLQNELSREFSIHFTNTSKYLTGISQTFLKSTQEEKVYKAQSEGTILKDQKNRVLQKMLQLNKQEIVNAELSKKIKILFINLQ